MRIREAVIGAACAAAAVVATPAAAGAAPATLDPSFGNGGLASKVIDNAETSGNNVAIDAQGRYVVVGGSGNRLAISRFLPNGAPDTNFGTGGSTTFAFGVFAAANGVAIQPDGKIVVAGESSPGGGIILRFTDGGVLDTTFNNPNGFLTVGADARFLNAVLVQPDGKLVVGGAGQTSPNDGFVVIRLSSSGPRDNSFDGDGVATPFLDQGGCGDSSSSGIDRMTFAPDGAILAAGVCDGVNPTKEKFGVARFKTTPTGPNGALDTTFGAGGTATGAPQPGVEGFANGLALQGDGKIVLTGQSGLGGTNSTAKVAAMRWNADGSPDPSYAAGGVQLFEVGGGPSGGSAGALDAGGGVVVSARRYPSSVGGFGMARLTPDGALDGAFGPGGSVFVPFASFGEPNAVALQADGKIVLAGSTDQGGTEGLTLARFLPPTTEPSTGGGGSGGGAGSGDGLVHGPGPEVSVGLHGATVSGLSYDGRTIAYTLTCPPGPVSCDGTITLTSATGKAKIAAKRKKKRKPRAVRIAAASFVSAAGQSQKGTMRPTRAGKALLRAKRSLRVVVTLTNPASSERTATTQALAVTAKKHRRKRH